MANTVIMVTSECKPFVKVGGLADVPYNLSLALRQKGYDVAVIMPRSGCNRHEECVSARKSRVTLPFGSSEVPFEITEALTEHGVWYYLIGGGKWQDAEPYPQDPEQSKVGENKWVREKALEFCKGAHLVAKSMLTVPQIPGAPRVQTQDFSDEKVVIHAHDWMSAFLLPLVKIDPAISPTPPCMYTIHNYFYTQFRASGTIREDKRKHTITLPHAISDYRFPWLTSYYLDNPKGFVDPFDHLIKFDRTGVYFADVVTSVSEDYKDTLMGQEELSYWTRGGLKKFYGILNGIDTEKHSPRAILRLKEDIPGVSKLEDRLDVSIEDISDPKSVEDVLANKRKAKILLFELMNRWKSADYIPEQWSKRKPTIAKNVAKFNLSWGPDDPLLLMIGRMQWQKGPDLFLRSLPFLVPEREPNARYIIAGSGIGVFEMKNPLRDIMNSDGKLYSENSVFINEYVPQSVCDLMYLAADGFVVPSRYEPCGLTPLEAMATGGTPSVVTPIGGLKEIVKDNITGIHIERCRKRTPTGLEPDPASIADAVCELLELERHDYAGVIENCFKRVRDPSLSWASVADRYVDCYNVGIRAYANFLRMRIEEGEGLRKNERADWQNRYGVRI